MNFSFFKNELDHNLSVYLDLIRTTHYFRTFGFYGYVLVEDKSDSHLMQVINCK